MKHASPLELRTMQNVKRLRKSKGLTTKDMGMLLGIQQSPYCHLENGYHHVPLDKLQKIAMVLNTSIAALITED